MLTLNLINPIPSVLARHNPSPITTCFLLLYSHQPTRILVQFLPVMLMLHALPIVHYLKALVAYAVDLRHRAVGQDPDQAVFGRED